MLKTTTTRSPLPQWIPSVSPRSKVDWPASKNTTLEDHQLRSNSTQLDPEDYEDESTPDEEEEQGDPYTNNIPVDIHVPVPIVPANFGDWKNYSKSQLPIGWNDEILEEQLPQANNFTTKKPPSLQVLANFTQYCPPARSRNLFWNWTLAVRTFSSILCFASKHQAFISSVVKVI